MLKVDDLVSLVKNLSVVHRNNNNNTASYSSSVNGTFPTTNAGSAKNISELEKLIVENKNLLENLKSMNSNLV